MEYQQFQRVHSSQLARIPQLYWEKLHEKLKYEVYDAGECFTMTPHAEGWKVVVSRPEGIELNDSNSVYLIDHAWTFQLHLAEQQLLAVPGLANRMAGLMDLYGVPGLPRDSCSSSEASASGSSEEGEDSDSVGSDGPGTTTPCVVVQPVLQDGQTGSIAAGRDSDSGTLDDRDGSGGDDSAVVTNGIGQPPAVPSNELVAEIMRRMWRFCGAYTINNARVPVWYIMDEFGSRIQHADAPSFDMITFFYIPSQMAFSLIWPLKDLTYGDEVTRNCLPPEVKAGLKRECHLVPWAHAHSRITLESPLWSQLAQFTVPDIQNWCAEDLPESPQSATPPKPLYKVYTDLDLVRSFLKHPSFQLTSSWEEADVLWLYDHFKDFRSLRPDQMVNQFPCESVLTCKDLLASVARRAVSSASGQQTPRWLPLTFNLLYELPHLVHSYLQREERGEDNLWIVKPWNLGRGLNIHISDNLAQIVRLAQVGPKVASTYITRPVLFDRPETGLVKFDVRYVVMLASVQPPVLFAYNVFWLRFANRAFSLDDFCDYEKHFTVMNYRREAELKQVHCDEFVTQFESQYPQFTWREIQDSVFSALRELFLAACSVGPPAGIAHCTQSRAMYAVDLMLEWEDTQGAPPTIQPKILEVNFCPDCTRACTYHPLFFNHVFEALFLGRTEGLPVTRLT